MKPFIFIIITCLSALIFSCASQLKTTHTLNSIDGFSSWITGHDAATIQLLPTASNNALIRDGRKPLVHVKFQVKQYGEVSFPINTKTPIGAEALQADISRSKQISITYQANQEFIVQLRQTGVHGGIHNQITLPAAVNFTTKVIQLTEFKGGNKALDLTDVAKFNFAFLSNNSKDGFAELKISSFLIEGHP